jgi:hypothetical protein
MKDDGIPDGPGGLTGTQQDFVDRLMGFFPETGPGGTIPLLEEDAAGSPSLRLRDGPAAVLGPETTAVLKDGGVMVIPAGGLSRADRPDGLRGTRDRCDGLCFDLLYVRNLIRGLTLRRGRLFGPCPGHGINLILLRRLREEKAARLGRDLVRLRRDEAALRREVLDCLATMGTESFTRADGTVFTRTDRGDIAITLP